MCIYIALRSCTGLDVTHKSNRSKDDILIVLPTYFALSSDFPKNKVIGYIELDGANPELILECDGVRMSISTVLQAFSPYSIIFSLSLTSKDLFTFLRLQCFLSIFFLRNLSVCAVIRFAKSLYLIKRSYF